MQSNRKNLHLIDSHKNIDKEIVRICHIASGDIWGGAETQVYSLIKSLDSEEGFEVEAIVFNEGELFKKLSAENLKTHLVNEVNKNLISIAFNIYRIIKHGKIDIVHVHGFKENFLGGIAAMFCSKLVVRTHHGRGMAMGRGLNAAIERFNGKFITRSSIAVSQDLKEQLVERHYASNKISVIHNGIDCPDKGNINSEDFGQSLGIEKNEYVIGIVGRLVPVKNHKCFLDSASILVGNCENVKFVVVGNGPLLNELKAYALELGIEDKLRFVGFKDDLRPFYELFDILAITSFHEGIPLTLLEAMCAGVPVVATRVGGIPEIIKSEHNGLLVPDNSCAELSKACIRLSQDKQLYESISRNAAHDMIRKNSLSKSITKTVKFYRSLLS